MDNILRRIVLAGIPLLAVAVQAAGQQKMQFTQYMFNGVVINPAYAGADEALSLTFIQRSQWVGVENAPATQTFSAHSLLKKKRFGLGLTVVNDKIGVHQNLSALGNYAYHLPVGMKSHLSMGLQAGVYTLKSDYASLIGASNNDPKIYAPIMSRTFFDFGAGVYFRSERFHAGISAPELVPQQFSVNDTLSIKLKRANLFVFSKYRMNMTDNVVLEPSMLFKYLPGVPVSFDVNMNMIYREVLTLGVSYRKTESFDFLLKAQVSPQLQFGYAYDYSLGIIAQLSSGSHELMVNYLFKYHKKNITSPR